MDRRLVQQFSTLFQGGKVAGDDPVSHNFRPMETSDGSYCAAHGESFERAVEAHLTDDKHPIGVYPLHVLSDSDGNEKHVVRWGCVDWDDGDAESFIHARNTQEVLKQIGIASWVERSRSKGYPLWVFLLESLEARFVREGVIGACKLVEAPTKEVNPKQTVLTGKGYGNGVRLPYPAGRNLGRNECVYPTNGSSIPLDVFVDDAYTRRVGVDQWRELHALYKPLPPISLRAPYTSPWAAHYSGPLGPFSSAIRNTGPRPTPMKSEGDRSATLFSLACAMWEEGHEPTRIFQELSDADRDWGNKYGSREDGARRLQEIVESSHRKVASERGWQ